MHKEKLSSDFKPHKIGLAKILGDTEIQIMELIWKKERCTVRDIYEEIRIQREIAYTTILTIMQRLVSKKLLNLETDRKTYYYTPAFSKEDLINQITQNVIDSLLEEFPDLVYDYLFENYKKTAESKEDVTD